ncbi:MAG: sulfotransferase [Pseudomonadota bacterium]
MASDATPAARAELTRDAVDHVIALREGGRLSEAMSAVTALQGGHPKSQLLHNIKGTIHAEMDEPEAALECYRSALKVQSSYAAAHNNMGFLFMKLGRFDEAVEAYFKAIKHLPNYVEAHVNLALVYLEMERPEDALSRCRKALEISPHNPHAHASLANALKDLGRHEEAVASYKTALALRPNHAETLSNLGQTRYELGQVDEGTDDFRHALSADPGHVHAHYNLAKARKFSSGDPQIAQMASLLAQSQEGSKDRILLHFALAKAHEECGQIEQAYGHLSEGNRLRKVQLAYTPERDKRLFDQVKATFSSGKDVRLGAKDLKPVEGGKTPIFILGMPRSGTTLVEQIIASHSQVHGAGELSFLGRNLGPQFDKLAPGKGLSINAYKLKSLRKSYQAGLAGLNVAEPFISDKLPGNFLWLGFIRAAMPEAKIIHVSRDPMATCWSNFKQFFAAAGMGYAFDLKDVATFYRLYEDIMAFWRARFGESIYELNYEQLTENQEAETRKLIAFCGLDWEDQCLAFHETDRAVSTASSLQVREAMYTGSSANWTKFETHLGPLKQSLAAEAGTREQS